MKAVLFSVFLFLLLVCGRSSLYAAKQQDCHSSVAHHQQKHHHVKFKDAEPHSTLIDNDEIDLEEDLLHGEDLQAGKISDKFFHGNYNLLEKWYQALHLAILNKVFDAAFQEIPEFSGHSSPIYIALRVLRI